MKLEAFFNRVAPLLEGRVPVEQGTRSLFPEPSLDARRLAIYARFCRVHRSQALSTFVYTREAIVALAGEETWLDLVERTFRAHPMRSFELNENGAPFPAFLPAHLRRLQLPGWLTELADFEWWEWRTRTALDQPGDANDRGPLRLAETVELRPYTHRWVAWIDDARRAGEPNPGTEVVLFWRDRDLDARREVASPEELAVLKALYEGGAAAEGMSRNAALRETLDDLRNAGIVRGGQPD